MRGLCFFAETRGLHLTTKRRIEKVRVSQLLLARRDNQQREVCVSSQQRRATRVSKPKRESCACSTRRELCISEPCVSVLRRSQELKSPQKPEANLFGPPPTDLRDYLTKKMSANQIAPSCFCEWLITAMLSECRCSSHVSKQLSLIHI